MLSRLLRWLAVAVTVLYALLATTGLNALRHDPRDPAGDLHLALQLLTLGPQLWPLFQTWLVFVAPLLVLAEAIDRNLASAATVVAAPLAETETQRRMRERGPAWTPPPAD